MLPSENSLFRSLMLPTPNRGVGSCNAPNSYVNSYFHSGINEIACSRYFQQLPANLKNTKVGVAPLHPPLQEEPKPVEELRPYLRPRSSEREALRKLGPAVPPDALRYRQKSCLFNRRGEACRGNQRCRSRVGERGGLTYLLNQTLLSTSLWESRLLILVYTAITTILLVLIDQNVIPQSGIYPMPETPFTWISGFFIFTFAILAAASYNRYDTPVKQFYAGLLGNLKNATINVTALLDDDATIKPIAAPRFVRDVSCVCGWKVEYYLSTAAEALNNLRHIMIALPFAMKITFRDGVKVDPSLLPMPTQLQTSLEAIAGGTADFLDGLRLMYVHQTIALTEVFHIPVYSTSSLLAHSNDMGGNIGEITYSRNVFSLTAILSSSMRLALYSWMAFVPFYLYQFWGLAMGIIFTALMNVLFIGVISTLDNTRNPFSKSNINEFLGIDMGAEARITAEQIDHFFDMTFLQLYYYLQTNIPDHILKGTRNGNQKPKADVPDSPFIPSDSGD